MRSTAPPVRMLVAESRTFARHRASSKQSYADLQCAVTHKVKSRLGNVTASSVDSIDAMISQISQQLTSCGATKIRTVQISTSGDQCRNHARRVAPHVRSRSASRISCMDIYAYSKKDDRTLVTMTGREKRRPSVLVECVKICTHFNQPTKRPDVAFRSSSVNACLATVVAGLQINAAIDEHADLAATALATSPVQRRTTIAIAQRTHHDATLEQRLERSHARRGQLAQHMLANTVERRTCLDQHCCILCLSKRLLHRQVQCALPRRILKTQIGSASEQQRQQVGIATCRHVASSASVFVRVVDARTETQEQIDDVILAVSHSEQQGWRKLFARHARIGVNRSTCKQCIDPNCIATINCLGEIVEQTHS
jgi:hypothetical protein